MEEKQKKMTKMMAVGGGYIERAERWKGRRRRALYVSERTIRGVHDTSPGVST